MSEAMVWAFPALTLSGAMIPLLLGLIGARDYWATAAVIEIGRLIYGIVVLRASPANWAIAAFFAGLYACMWWIFRNDDDDYFRKRRKRLVDKAKSKLREFAAGKVRPIENGVRA